ncbi:MAG TPA: hypothetical protein VF139_18030 [Candidatus Polarisedimenticolaceae bacterium]
MLRSIGRTAWVCLAACLLAVGSPDVAARDTAPKKKELQQVAPALPSGGERDREAKIAPYPRTDTITSHRNAQGQSVYAVAASHFDVSEPLEVLAARAPAVAVEREDEPPRNPLLPPWRRIRSGVPDPVAQPAPAGGTFLTGTPTIGFNFPGVGTVGLTPSDSNGSVGNNQFVETVNTRYQVWSLNRSNKTATSLLGPININTLWSGFGGACETQNSGDPIVLFDKLANRWLISQFTSSPANGTYYQCVAVSTGANAAGAYFRWAFAVPNGRFGDYPHFGAWSDAYYLMAHAFTSSSGSYVAALFAAMDRGKMIAGSPDATWQVIEDPFEGGHMPADLDGFAPPPTGAPGIFLSVHGASMHLYRMKVDFQTPANTTRTRQAVIPIAPATGACNGGGDCIPQPGTTQTLSSLGDRLMFRAAYRNFVDHESLVVSHSVDPSVSGVASGVRWYDFRLSGSPDAVCSAFPCVRQQGTVADVPGGRSRWMPSVAMDTAENILVGYSTTGLTAGSDNHSIRFTGRSKDDPLGSMTVAETTIVTGTANNTNARWGDYTSMSVDPFDDCTFWYVGQYFATAGNWSTRVASAAWPNGSGAGFCPATACTTRPPSAPTIGAATVPADNRITVSWTGLVPAPGAYAIERADGTCANPGLYRPLASVPGTTTTFTDTSVLGGLSYAYRVIAATDAAGKCQSLVASGCTEATATGTCNLKPSFAGAASGTSANGTNCGVTLQWNPATTSCPLTPNVRYNVYRGTTPDFVPSAASRIATCVTGPSSHTDVNALSSGVTYYYVVRAEDDSTGNGGPCGGGNEETNAAVVPGTAYGPGTQPSPGTWTDGGGDGTAFLQLNAAGAGNTSDPSWRVVRAADDAGANHTASGAYAYRNAGPAASNTYTPNTCTEVQSPALTAGATSLNLRYWERHQLEYHWDGVAVEYSVNGGPWNDVPAPSNDNASGCEVADATTGWEPLACTQSPPINACGYPATKNVLNGPFASGTSCNDYGTGGVTAYARRCHPISGLADGDAVRFRWRFASDPAAEFAGLYLDDVEVTNVKLPNACVPDTCASLANGAACDDGNACTAGDSCGGGTCQPGATIPVPAEVAGVAVSGSTTTTIAWTGLGGGVVYDVASAALSELRTSGTTTATCLGNDLANTSFDDARPDPASGDGWYYLVRAQSGCGAGTYGFDSTPSERMPAAGCP